MTDGTHYVTAEDGRIVFPDWLRVVACLMVMLVHACEGYYLDAEGNFHILTASHAFWVSWIDGACRAAVPLFVMASAFLLFPVKRATGDFFRRRLLRVVVPFAVWSAVYTLAYGGDWGPLAFNFAMTVGGHLWFVPMLLGLYLAMPLLSPWAERVSERELRGWIGLWLFTTLFPFLRHLWGVLYGAPSFGAVPYLYGECPWNAFGTFQYVSGFIGYLLVGFWFRKFAHAPDVKSGRLWNGAVPFVLWVVGLAIAGGFFYGRMPGNGVFPVVRPYATAVDMEMSWEFCGIGVFLMTVAYFAFLARHARDGVVYRHVIRPLAEASYGTYLMHMIILTPVLGFFKPQLPMPVAVVATAAVTFASASLASLTFRRMPFVGRFLG